MDCKGQRPHRIRQEDRHLFHHRHSRGDRRHGDGPTDRHVLHDLISICFGQNKKRMGFHAP